MHCSLAPKDMVHIRCCKRGPTWQESTDLESDNLSSVPGSGLQMGETPATGGTQGCVPPGSPSGVPETRAVLFLLSRRLHARRGPSWEPRPYMLTARPGAFFIISDSPHGWLRSSWEAQALS